MNNIKKNTHIAGTMISLISTFMILFTANVYAAPSYKDIQQTGSWSGITTDKNDEDIKAILEIEQASNDGYKYTLIYKSPRSCRLKAEELSADDNVLKLKFFEANGGYCDKLYKGKITLTIENKNTISALIEQKSKNIKETARLKRK